MMVRIKAVYAFGERIAEAYNRHFGTLMAAAVSFYALLAALPLLSVGVAVLGWFVGGSEQALAQVKESIQDYLPASGGVIYETLAEIKRDSGILGFVGLVGLLLTGSAIFTNLEIAFNNIWGAPTMRNWWKQRLAALGTTLATVALLLASVGVTWLLTYAENARLPGTQYHAGQIPFFSVLATHLVTLSLSTAMFVLVYKIVPNKPILWREALIGGLFAGVAWEGAKYFFALYLARFGNYNKVYGSLGGLVILVVWTYYSMTILFLGAEIAADQGTKLPAADEKPEHVPCPQPVEEE
jgi:membrane protein